MKKMYYNFFQTDNQGGYWGFFEVKKNKLILIDKWHENDGDFKKEYMSQVFNYFNILVDKLPRLLYSKGMGLIEETDGAL